MASHAAQAIAVVREQVSADAHQPAVGHAPQDAQTSPGRHAWHGVGEDEAVAEAEGIDLTNYLMIFLIIAKILT